MIDLSDDALSDMVDRERYLWRDDPTSGETLLERAAKAHWLKVNDLAPDWLQDHRAWEDLSKEEHAHHRRIALAVIEAAGGPLRAV